MFSLFQFGLLPTVLASSIMLSGHSNFPKGVNVCEEGCLSLYVIPAMNCQLVHGVICPVILGQAPVTLRRVSSRNWMDGISYGDNKFKYRHLNSGVSDRFLIEFLQKSPLQTEIRLDNIEKSKEFIYHLSLEFIFSVQCILCVRGIQFNVLMNFN